MKFRDATAMPSPAGGSVPLRGESGCGAGQRQALPGLKRGVHDPGIQSFLNITAGAARHSERLNVMLDRTS